MTIRKLAGSMARVPRPPEADPELLLCDLCASARVNSSVFEPIIARELPHSGHTSPAVCRCKSYPHIAHCTCCVMRSGFCMANNRKAQSSALCARRTRRRNGGPGSGVGAYILIVQSVTMSYGWLVTPDTGLRTPDLCPLGVVRRLFNNGQPTASLPTDKPIQPVRRAGVDVCCCDHAGLQVEKIGVFDCCFDVEDAVAGALRSYDTLHPCDSCR